MVEEAYRNPPVGPYDIFYWAQQTFNCELNADYQMDSVTTLGELHTHLLQKIRAPHRGDCLKLAFFNRIRKLLVETLGIDRNAIKPHTPLTRLFPRNRRRALWCSFRHKLGKEFGTDDLQYAPFVRNIVGAIAVLTLLSSVLLAFVSFPVGIKILPFLLCSIFICAVTTKILDAEATSSQALHFSDRCNTPWKIVTAITNWTYKDLAEETGCWSEEELWSVIKAVVADLYEEHTEDLSKSTVIETLVLSYD